MDKCKKEELETRTIAVLERTKKYVLDYAKERNILYKYLKSGENLDKWEEYLFKVEKLTENL